MKIKSLLNDVGMGRLLTHSSEVTSLLNASFEIVYSSPNLGRITGWNGQEQRRDSLGQLVHQEDLEDVMQLLYDIARLDGLSKTAVFRITTPDDTCMWVESSFTNLLEDPHVSAIVWQYHSIQSTNEASRLIEQSNSELHAYKYALDESAIVAVTDQKGIIKHVNQKFSDISGYLPGELLGKDHRIVSSGFHDKSYIRSLWVTIASGKVWKGELKNKAKNGSEYWVDTTIVPFLDKNGKPYQYIAIRFDITRRKLSEEKLQSEEQHLRLLELVITNTRDAILVTEAEPRDERESRIIFVNEAFTHITGYTSEEVTGKTPGILQGSKTDRSELDRLAGCLLRGESCDITVVNYKKNGEEFWTHLTVTPVAGESRYTHWIWVVRDVTESRNLQDLLGKITMLAGIGGWVVDLTKETMLWSGLTRDIHEVAADYEPDIQTGLEFYKGEKDKQLVTGAMQQAIEKGIPFDFEAEIITARQNSRWVRVIGEPEFENNTCVRIRGSFQDIDVRKRAELAATAALAERNVILESIGDAFFAVDSNWIVTYWNNMAVAVLNKAKEQAEGQNLWEVFADSTESISYRKYHEAVETNRAIHFEDYYSPLDKWYGISAYPSSNGLSVYFKDITESKRINSALQESELNYSSLFELSPLPMWVFDLDTLKFLNVNRAAIENYGYAWEEFLSMTIRDIRPIEDLPKLQGTLNEDRMPHEAVRSGIFRHLKKNGELIHVDIQSNLIQYKGRPAKVIIANDMTERHRYIKAIEGQNAKLREIAFLQSHVVRAPLARIMSIVPMLQNTETFAEEREKLLEFLLVAAKELDQVVKDISSSTSLAGVQVAGITGS